MYGSYARGEETIGDLDLAVELQPKNQDSDDQAKAEEARISTALKSGRRLSNIVEQISWPRTEIYLHVKNRAKGVSLHNHSEFLRLPMERLQYQVLIGCGGCGERIGAERFRKDGLTIFGSLLLLTVRL